MDYVKDNATENEIAALLAKVDSAKVYVMDLSPTYAAFKQALHNQILLMEEDDANKEYVESAIITRMMSHVLEFQRNNDIHYAERCAKMAINILREYDLADVERVCSAWLPILLYGTGLFIKKRYGDISRVWELKAAVEGVLWISPVIEELVSKESPNEDHVS